jgi:hypothetical protein
MSEETKPNPELEGTTPQDAAAGTPPEADTQQSAPESAAEPVAQAPAIDDTPSTVTEPEDSGAATVPESVPAVDAETPEVDHRATVPAFPVAAVEPVEPVAEPVVEAQAESEPEVDHRATEPAFPATANVPVEPAAPAEVALLSDKEAARKTTPPSKTQKPTSQPKAAPKAAPVDEEYIETAAPVAMLTKEQQRARKQQQQTSFEEVEANPLGESGDQIAEIWAKYRTIIVAAGVGLVALVGGLYYWNVTKDENEAKAAKDLVGAFFIFEQDSFQKAIVGTAQYPGLEKTANNYGSTGAGKVAKQLLANAYLQTGETDKALSHLKDISGDGDAVEISAGFLEAQALESKGQFAAAAKAYEKLAKAGDNFLMPPFFWLRAGWAWEKADDKAKALAAFKTVKQEYPNSPQAAGVEKYIARNE